MEFILFGFKPIIIRIWLMATTNIPLKSNSADFQQVASYLNHENCDVLYTVSCSGNMFSNFLFSMLPQMFLCAVHSKIQSVPKQCMMSTHKVMVEK